MTSMQRTALENHCRLAFETMQQRFITVVAGGKATVLLTVNSGHE